MSDLTDFDQCSDQSTYNPIECNMTTLSQKLAGITLPIDKYDSHLNSQGQVIDLKLKMPDETMTP